MPYKSRKNRRPIAASRMPAANVTGTNGNTVSAAAAAGTSQPVKSSSGFSKASSAAVPLQTHFLSELKWITLVAVIIVVLLIVAYYIFR